MLGRKVPTACIAQLRRGRASALKLALCAYLVGDRGGDEVLLGGEVSIEGAVGQPRIRHEGGDPRAVDAVSPESTAGGLDDPLPRLPLALFPVPHHTLLAHWQDGLPSISLYYIMIVI